MVNPSLAIANMFRILSLIFVICFILFRSVFFLFTGFISWNLFLGDIETVYKEHDFNIYSLTQNIVFKFYSIILCKIC